MEIAREFTSLALEARSEADIKTRQPLESLTLKTKDLPDEYLEIIKDEVNVKEISTDMDIVQESF